MSDDPQPAARVEDTVQHSQARIGRGLGALGGAALAIGVLVLAGALEIGSAGLATPVVIGLGALAVGGIGAAMSAGSNLGADAGRAQMFMHDDGKIASGVSTILIGPERKFAAHINSNVNCDDHKHLAGGPWSDAVNAAQEQIAEGSGTVLIGPGLMPFARVGSQGTCGFTVGHGCSTVIIGGPTLRLLKVGDGDDPDKGFFDGLGTASGWIGIAGAALVLWPLGVTAMAAGGAGAFLIGKAAGPVLNLLPEGAPRDAAALALAVLPLALLPGMARGLSPNERLTRGAEETPEGFASRVKAAENARLEAEWRAKVEASKPHGAEIPLGPDGQPIPLRVSARAGEGEGAGGGRQQFDDGGGVHSPKKGSGILKMTADDAAEEGAGGPRLKPNGEFEDPALEAKYQRYTRDNAARGRGVRDRLDWKRESDNWANGPAARGNAFNRTVNARGDYPYSEVYLENGKFVDGYRPPEGNTPGEIVSRKAIDFDGYSESSFRSHLSEFNAKYQPGTEIASRKYPQLNGETLSGRKILEVPETNRGSANSQRFEEIAREYGIEIRYTPEH